MSKKLYDDYNPKKDLINENTYPYTGIKSDILGILLLALSVLSIYISIFFSYIALPVCVLLLVFSILQHNRNKTISTSAAITASSLSLALSLFIVAINFIIY